MATIFIPREFTEAVSVAAVCAAAGGRRGGARNANTFIPMSKLFAANHDDRLTDVLAAFKPKDPWRR
jgi:hypothetical protein